jgi:hypothetical protein
MAQRRLVVVLLVCFTTEVEVASAAEYLTDVTSEVYQFAGTPKDTATRANTCISQHLAPGTTDSQLIISSDLEGGVVVARNALEYGNFPRWKIRGILTFEARDGRFRIKQTNLERFNDMGGGWGPNRKVDWFAVEKSRGCLHCIGNDSSAVRCVRLKEGGVVSILR